MKRNTVIIAVVMAALVAAVGGYVLVQKQTQNQALQDILSFQKALDTTLDSFVVDIQTKMRAYKDERKIAFDLLKPENLRDPAYIDENVTVMSGLVPSLNAKNDELLNIFAKTEDKVLTLLERQPEDVRNAVLTKWEDLKRVQIAPYSTFFELEKQVLKAQQDLLAFYATKKGAFDVDPATLQIVFKDPADQAQADQLKGAVVALLQQQVSVASPAKAPG